MASFSSTYDRAALPSDMVPGGNKLRKEIATCALWRNGKLFGRFAGVAAAEAKARNVDAYCGEMSRWEIRPL